MNIILLGAPGAGKGTQAKMLAAEYKIPHISTGDIFRSNMANATPIGLLAKSYIDKGQLVPDDVTIKIVENRLLESDCKSGYILDGFPRTIYQAQALEEISPIDCVIDIDIPIEYLLKRLTGRRVCPACGASYHIDTLGGRSTCECGTELVHRSDDNEQSVSERIHEYKLKTQPLVDFYTEKQLLIKINGNQSVQAVFAETKNRLKK